ncbi:Uncharacterised protein [Candidatus Gugararchaeum adminiculabundum]|nr:Uncharacterised protein [Candidatus Gugararchaeum adminiculabundum]
MKTILFYWSKGADVRRKIIKAIAECEKKENPCYLNLLAEKFELSHVAVKKHLDLLLEEGYVKILNPDGKPVYLALTKKGTDMLQEFSGR